MAEELSIANEKLEAIRKLMNERRVCRSTGDWCLSFRDIEEIMNS